MEGKLLIGNYKFSYSLSGNSHRPTILFLHGFMGDRHDFAAVIDLLPNQYQYLAFDLPGHGKTQVTETADYEMVAVAQAIIAALDRLKIAQCYLVGYSMGGRLALYLTLRFPERFLKTLLESASPGLKTVEERRLRSQQDEKLAAEMGAIAFTDFLTKWYGQPLFASLVRSPYFGQLLKQRQQNNPAELANSLRYFGTGSQPSLWTELALNQVPLCLVVGECDRKFVSISQDMQAHCSSIQIQIMKECGHNVHFENVPGFVEILKGFFEGALG